jgi:GH15 family glucan-1,4-alpha-glucosidase
MIQRDRLTAILEDRFVVFLIGMRINQPLLIHKWWPVAMAMPRMLKELYRQPELGLLHAETWFSRTIIVLQYWRSMEHLLAYAKLKEAAHLPAWQAFNKAIGVDGSVGIWHETYQVSPGGYENVYVNMPPFGLGRAGKLQEAKGDLKSASDRLRANAK